jgi:hypothetical protein
MAHVSLADIAREGLHVRDQFRPQCDLSIVELRRSRNVASRHSDSKKPNNQKDNEEGERDSKDTPHDASSAYPIFFRKRRAHTQKRKTAMPDMMARDCQYSKKFAPRRMMARMSEMK